MLLLWINKSCSFKFPEYFDGDVLYTNYVGQEGSLTSKYVSAHTKLIFVWTHFCQRKQNFKEHNSKLYQTNSDGVLWISRIPQILYEEFKYYFPNKTWESVNVQMLTIFYV
jgi:hypothetical protein